MSALPFPQADVDQAIAHIEAMGFHHEELLAPIADLAAVMGHALLHTATVVTGTLLGKDRAIALLVNHYGTSPATLRRYGAHVDEAGLVHAGSPDDLQRLHDAVLTCIREQWSGAAARATQLGARIE